jgi:hypothetical protein
MKKIKMLVMVTCLCCTVCNSIVFAGEVEPKTDTSGFSPIEAYQKQQTEKDPMSGLLRSSDNNAIIYLANGETFKANAWRSTFATSSGNTKKWSYIVSSVYTGSIKVDTIRTTWQLQASLRYGASIGFGADIGIDGGGAQASNSSTWQTVRSPVKYYENNNGAKVASMPSQSNFAVAPKSDYKNSSIALFNTGKLKFVGDTRTHEITASV